MGTEHSSSPCPGSSSMTSGHPAPLSLSLPPEQGDHGAGAPGARGFWLLPMHPSWCRVLPAHSAICFLFNLYSDKGSTGWSRGLDQALAHHSLAVWPWSPHLYSLGHTLEDPPPTEFPTHCERKCDSPHVQRGRLRLRGSHEHREGGADQNSSQAHLPQSLRLPRMRHSLESTLGRGPRLIHFPHARPWGPRLPGGSKLWEALGALDVTNAWVSPKEAAVLQTTSCRFGTHGPGPATCLQLPGATMGTPAKTSAKT